MCIRDSTYATPEDGLRLRKLEKSISETITRYDEKGNVRRVRQGKPAKKVVIPGMYKPTKSKDCLLYTSTGYRCIPEQS